MAKKRIDNDSRILQNTPTTVCSSSCFQSFVTALSTLKHLFKCREWNENNFAVDGILSRYGYQLFNSFFDQYANNVIQIKKIYQIEPELKCLFDGESGLSILYLSELLPRVQAVVFTDLSREEASGTQHFQCIGEFAELSRSLNLKHIEFRVEYEKNTKEDPQILDSVTKKQSDLTYWGWCLKYECYGRHYHRIKATKNNEKCIVNDSISTRIYNKSTLIQTKHQNEIGGLTKRDYLTQMIRARERNPRIWTAFCQLFEDQQFDTDSIEYDMEIFVEETDKEINWGPISATQSESKSNEMETNDIKWKSNINIALYGNKGTMAAAKTFVHVLCGGKLVHDGKSATNQNGKQSKIFVLTLDADERAFHDFGVSMTIDSIRRAIIDMLSQCEFDDYDLAVDILNITSVPSGVAIKYLLSYEIDDQKQLILLDKMQRIIDFVSELLVIGSMQIAIEKHAEIKQTSLADQLLNMEMFRMEIQTERDELMERLDAVKGEAERKWTTKRQIRLDEVRELLLEEREAIKKEWEIQDLHLDITKKVEVENKPLFRLNAVEFWSTIGWWIIKDIKYQNALKAMKKLFAEYQISGALICYLYVEGKTKKTKLVEKVMKDEMRRLLSEKTIEIMLTELREWTRTISVKPLYKITSDDMAGLMMQFPIRRLRKAILSMEDGIDGKGFISNPSAFGHSVPSVECTVPFETFVRRQTGWPQSECKLLTEVVKRRASLESDQLLKSMGVLARDKFKNKNLVKTFISKMQRLCESSSGSWEDAHYELVTRGTVNVQFRTKMVGVLNDLMTKGLDDDVQYVEEFYDVIASALLEQPHAAAVDDDDEKEQINVGRPWICSFCGNVNVVKLMGYKRTFDFSICSLCGTHQKDAIIMVFKQIPSPFHTFQGNETASNTDETDILSRAKGMESDLHCATQRDSNLCDVLYRVADILVKQKPYQQRIEKEKNNKSEPVSAMELKEHIPLEKYKETLLKVAEGLLQDSEDSAQDILIKLLQQIHSSRTSALKQFGNMIMRLAAGPKKVEMKYTRRDVVIEIILKNVEDAKTLRNVSKFLEEHDIDTDAIEYDAEIFHGALKEVVELEIVKLNQQIHEIEKELEAKRKAREAEIEQLFSKERDPILQEKKQLTAEKSSAAKRAQDRRERQRQNKKRRKDAELEYKQNTNELMATKAKLIQKAIVRDSLMTGTSESGKRRDKDKNKISGPIQRKSKWPRKSWDSKWLVLRNNELIYFDNEKDAKEYYEKWDKKKSGKDPKFGMMDSRGYIGRLGDCEFDIAIKKEKDYVTVSIKNEKLSFKKIEYRTWCDIIQGAPSEWLEVQAERLELNDDALRSYKDAVEEAKVKEKEQKIAADNAANGDHEDEDGTNGLDEESENDENDSSSLIVTRSSEPKTDNPVPATSATRHARVHQKQGQNGDAEKLLSDATTANPPRNDDKGSRGKPLNENDTDGPSNDVTEIESTNHDATFGDMSGIKQANNQVAPSPTPTVSTTSAPRTPTKSKRMPTTLPAAPFAVNERHGARQKRHDEDEDVLQKYEDEDQGGNANSNTLQSGDKQSGVTSSEREDVRQPMGPINAMVTNNTPISTSQHHDKRKSLCLIVSKSQLDDSPSHVQDFVCSVDTTTDDMRSLPAHHDTTNPITMKTLTISCSTISSTARESTPLLSNATAPTAPRLRDPEFTKSKDEVVELLPAQKMLDKIKKGPLTTLDDEDKTLEAEKQNDEENIGKVTDHIEKGLNAVKPRIQRENAVPARRITVDPELLKIKDELFELLPKQKMLKNIKKDTLSALDKKEEILKAEEQQDKQKIDDVKADINRRLSAVNKKIQREKDSMESLKNKSNEEWVRLYRERDVQRAKLKEFAPVPDQEKDPKDKMKPLRSSRIRKRMNQNRWVYGFLFVFDGVLMFFEHKDEALEYFQDSAGKKGNHTKHDGYIAKIDKFEVTQNSKNPKDGKKYVFSVKNTSKKKVHFIQANSNEDLRAWCTSLNNAKSQNLQTEAQRGFLSWAGKAASSLASAVKSAVKGKASKMNPKDSSILHTALGGHDIVFHEIADFFHNVPADLFQNKDAVLKSLGNALYGIGVSNSNDSYGLREYSERYIIKTHDDDYQTDDDDESGICKFTDYFNGNGDGGEFIKMLMKIKMKPDTASRVFTAMRFELRKLVAFDKYRQWLDTLVISDLYGHCKHIQMYHLKDASDPKRNAINSFFQKAVHGINGDTHCYGVTTSQFRELDDEYVELQALLRYMHLALCHREQFENDEDTTFMDQIYGDLSEKETSAHVPPPRRLNSRRTTTRNILSNGQKSIRNQMGNQSGNLSKFVTWTTSKTEFGFGVQMNYCHMTPRYCSIREEVERIIGQNGFKRVLEKALERYRKFKASSDGLRRANEYSENDGVLRNECLRVKHIAAVVLYTDWTELCHMFIVCSKHTVRNYCRNLVVDEQSLS